MKRDITDELYVKALYRIKSERPDIKITPTYMDALWFSIYGLIKEKDGIALAKKYIESATIADDIFNKNNKQKGEIMKKLGKKVTDILENNGFNIFFDNDNPKNFYVELETSTPLGQDWVFDVRYRGTNKDFIDEFIEMYNNFDVDEEFNLLWERHGKHGVPNSASDLIEDQRWKEKMLQKVSDELMKVY